MYVNVIPEKEERKSLKGIGTEKRPLIIKKRRRFLMHSYFFSTSGMLHIGHV